MAVSAETGISSSALQLNNRVLSGTQPGLLAAIDNAGAVTLVDALQQGLGVVVLVVREIEDLVQAELVQGHRIKRRGNADVLAY